MNKSILFIFITFYSISTFAEWRIETFDRISESSQNQSAMVKNEQGFELAIFVSKENIVWMDFSLSDNSFDEFSRTQLPLFQIDNHKPVQMLRGFVATIVPADEGIEAIIVNSDDDISTAKDFSVDHIIAERLPERVICPIWQGEDRPHLNTIEALTKGNIIRFDYVSLDDKKRQTSFTLKGAKEAINEIITQ